METRIFQRSSLTTRIWKSLVTKPVLCNSRLQCQRRPLTTSPSLRASPNVRIMEVGPRDGLQNIKQTVPTSTKIEFIRRLAATGLTTIEATSFVSPKWIPQLADGAEVMAQIQNLPPQISFPVLVPNVKGLDRAVQSKVGEVVVFASATEGFSRMNTNCSVEEALGKARDVAKSARKRGIAVRGMVSCIFACPYDGPTPPSSVLNVVKQLLDLGCYEVGLGDTLGVGTPMDTQKLLEVLLKDIPEYKLAGHFHDTYGQAVANVVRAYDMGIRTFDSSVAGLGGCPYAKGAKGNLATEDVVYTFERMGFSTGIDLPKLVSVGEWISRELGLPNGSRAGAALFAKQEAAAEAETSASSASVSPPKQESVPTGLSSIVAPSQSSSLQEPPGAAPPSVQNNSQPSSSPQLTRTWKPVENTGEYSISRSGNVVKITLTRPQNGNAMTSSMLVGLTRLFQTLSRDRSVFHILVAAEGKYFCTGMDLSSGGTTTTSEKSHFSKFVEFFNAVDRAPQTTIAMIDGPAFGGGVGLSFACDIRLVSSRARFTLSEIKLGLSPAIISPYVIREWGISFAREAILSGREVHPAQLQHIGAVHGIADPPDTLEALVNNYLGKLSKCAPRSANECKELVRLGWTDPGGRGQEVKVKEIFENMMAEGSEGRFGIEQFRRKVRGVDWGLFWKGLGVGAKL